MDPRIPAELFVPPSPDLPHRVVAYISDVKRGGGLPPHSHPRAQLLAVVSGSIAVRTDEGTFVVPPERALWIPPAVVHWTNHLASTRVQTLYVMPSAAPNLPTRTTVVQVSPLMRSLLDAAMLRPRAYDETGADGRLLQVLLDQIGSSRALPLHLPMPVSPMLRRMADWTLAHPGNPRSILEWSTMVGLSVRTLERRFRAETGLSFRSFRRQAKLFKALELLATGATVNEISDRIGFEGPSAFIAMFKAAFGVTPGRYLR